MRRYEPLVQAALRRRRVDRFAERDDLAQEARLGILAAIRVWREDRGAFAALAEHCVMNRLVEALRRAARRKHHVLNRALSLDVPLPWNEQLPRLGEETGPERHAIANAELAAIIAGMDGLTARQRAIVRAGLNGVSMIKIAAEQRTTPKAIESCEARARRRLAQDPIFAAA